MDAGPNSEAFMSNLGYSLHQVYASRISGLTGITFLRSVARSLNGIIDMGGYDAIVSEWQCALAVTSVMDKRMKKGLKPIPWLFEDRSPPANSSLLGRLQWLLYDRAWNRAAHKANAIEVLVPGLEKFVRSRYGQLPRMVHCPSGVDCDRFGPSETELDNTIRIVYHGTLDQERGLERIVDLGKALSKIGIAARIRVFGAGPESIKFDQWDEEYDWIEFLGNVQYDDVPSLLSENDFGILPLPDRLPWRVGSPLKIMEYSASGLCVLATDVDGTIPFRDQPWLVCASNNDPLNEWVEYIESTMRKRSDFPSLRKSARVYAENHLTWDKSVEELDRELRRISGIL